jgi:hypothetical protein
VQHIDLSQKNVHCRDVHWQLGESRYSFRRIALEKIAMQFNAQVADASHFRILNRSMSAQPPSMTCSYATKS